MDFITVSTIFSCVEYYQNISQFIGFFESRDSALNALVESPYKAAGMALVQAQNSSIADERLSLLRDARRSYTQAITLEKKDKLALSHVGLALCHHLLGDERNCEITLRKLLDDVSHSGWFGSLENIKQIKDQTYDYLGEKSPWRLEEERVDLVKQANTLLEFDDMRRDEVSQRLNEVVFDQVRTSMYILTQCIQRYTTERLSEMHTFILELGEGVREQGASYHIKGRLKQTESRWRDDQRLVRAGLEEIVRHINTISRVIGVPEGKLLKLDEELEPLGEEMAPIMDLKFWAYREYLLQITVERRIKDLPKSLKFHIQKHLYEAGVYCIWNDESLVQPYTAINSRATAGEAQARIDELNVQNRALTQAEELLGAYKLAIGELTYEEETPLGTLTEHGSLLPRSIKRKRPS